MHEIAIRTQQHDIMVDAKLREQYIVRLDLNTGSPAMITELRRLNVVM